MNKDYKTIVNIFLVFILPVIIMATLFSYILDCIKTPIINFQQRCSSISLETDIYPNPIQIYYSEDDNIGYFFLPSNKSIDSIKLKCERLSIQYNDTIIGNGDDWNNVAYDSFTEVTILDNDSKRTKEIRVCFKTQNSLPTVFVSTESGSLLHLNRDKENKENGSLYISDIDGTCLLNAEMSISGRGNSTWSHSEKKPYNIKLNQKESVLEMSPAKDWCLLANAFDYSYMNNVLAFDMANYAEMAFTPDYRYVNVYFNGEFYGLYLITEKIEVDKNRIDVTDLDKSNKLANPDINIKKEAKPASSGNLHYYSLNTNPVDISGGYLLERNYRLDPSYPYGYSKPDCWFLTKNNNGVEIKSPSYASKEETEYICNKYSEMEDAIYADDGICQTSLKHYYDYIDLESWVKWYMAAEIAYDTDKSGTNMYIYKYQDNINDKLFIGPVWDFDNRWGGTEEYRSPKVLSLLHLQGVSSYFPYLYQKNEFNARIKELWKSVYSPYLKEIASKKIDNWSSLITTSAENDKLRWPEYHQNTLDSETTRLKNWIAERERFLSSQWNE